MSKFEKYKQKIKEYNELEVPNFRKQINVTTNYIYAIEMDAPSLDLQLIMENRKSHKKQVIRLTENTAEKLVKELISTFDLKI